MLEPTALENRVLKLERELKWLRIGIVLVLLFTAGLSYATRRESQRLFITDSLIVPTTWYAGPHVGISPSKDGKDIVMWIGELRTNTQIRMGFEDNAQALTFFDKRGKLRVWLGVGQDGSAKLRLLDPSGKEVWSTDRPSKPGAV